MRRTKKVLILLVVAATTLSAACVKTSPIRLGHNDQFNELHVVAVDLSLDVTGEIDTGEYRADLARKFDYLLPKLNSAHPLETLYIKEITTSIDYKQSSTPARVIRAIISFIPFLSPIPDRHRFTHNIEYALADSQGREVFRSNIVATLKMNSSGWTFFRPHFASKVRAMAPRRSAYLVATDIARDIVRHQRYIEDATRRSKPAES